MLTIETLKRGIEKVNLVYIERPELDGNYPAMVVKYLMGILLIALGGKANDFGLFTNPNIGYTGYIALDDKVLFFAPTKAILMDRAETGEVDGELSPYGVIP